MIFGTHNSATGGHLVWWLRPIGGIINPTSKCQDRTIAQQLHDGVKVFNIQVAYIGGRWRFSHGLALYKEDVWETLALMKACATEEEPIYFQLYLDRCFWCKQDVGAFNELIDEIKERLVSPHFVMLYAWVEGSDRYFERSDVSLDMSEHYWTTAWAKRYGKRWLDYLPLPKWHARRYNGIYKTCKDEYLMLDYYEWG